MQTNGFGADIGKGGAGVNVALKSGSNQLHGSVYEFLRNFGLRCQESELFRTGKSFVESPTYLARNVTSNRLTGPGYGGGAASDPSLKLRMGDRPTTL